MKREIVYFGNYFNDFFATLTIQEKQKVLYVLEMLITQNRISSKFITHIREGVFQLRIEYGSNIYRIFFVFDLGNIVVLFNGFQKKTQKTPKNEIDRALKIKKEYDEYKQQVAQRK
ncbi:MAG TPA: type II toxin-antitoxin system RelE/ParE family toxin [Bacteroidales bacterium]|jgi:phage-related protein|nr:type II toxin-antitoxin system RelE/ParE family toxin [Bacteroidales bacterium]HHY01240.1 type II toxin-antitoxin system RelE/ParE family toxin [Methanothermobacter sp.]